MHQFLSAIGLSEIDTRKKMNSFLSDIIKNDINAGLVRYGDTPIEGESAYFAQIKHYFNSSCGLSVYGTFEPNVGRFVVDYYLPFLDSTTSEKQAEISIGRRADKDSYNVLCDEPGRGIALIFQLINAEEYLNRKSRAADLYDKSVRVSAMSTEGIILLPVNKSKEQIDRRNEAIAARNNLINLAKKGDSAAIDNLTIEDLDTYTDIFKRIKKEDVLSIVDTCFMPSGFECDSYTVIGNILHCNRTKNNLTGEEIYIMTLECNDIFFDLCINAKAVYGVPEEGRRFKGRIWLQGEVDFSETSI